MAKYRINARRYDTNGNPITPVHSTIIDTVWEEYKKADSEHEISEIFKNRFNVPQRDGSQIRVDSIEQLV